MVQYTPKPYSNHQGPYINPKTEAAATAMETFPFIYERRLRQGVTGGFYWIDVVLYRFHGCLQEVS